MRKSLFAILLIIALVMTCIPTSASGKVVREEALLEACFETSGAQISEAVLNAYGKISEEYETTKTLSTMLDNVLEYLEIDKKTIKRNIENSEQLRKVSVYEKRNGKNYSIAIESIKKEKGGETYLVINVNIDEEAEELTDIRAKIDQCFAGKSPQIRSCIIGAYEGKLSSQSIKINTARILKSAEAKKIEGIDTEDVTSITAYSKNLRSFIYSGKNKINLQISNSYNECENKTFIWIATPLIPVEY